MKNKSTVDPGPSTYSSQNYARMSHLGKNIKGGNIIVQKRLG